MFLTLLLLKFASISWKLASMFLKHQPVRCFLKDCEYREIVLYQHQALLDDEEVQIRVRVRVRVREVMLSQ
jgi:hypothetical protein